MTCEECQAERSALIKARAEARRKVLDLESTVFAFRASLESVGEALGWPERDEPCAFGDFGGHVAELVAERNRYRAAIAKHREDSRREYGSRPEDHSDQDAALWAHIEGLEIKASD